MLKLNVIVLMISCVLPIFVDAQCSDSVQQVAHTEYIGTHRHGELRIEQVAGPETLPFKSLFQMYEFEFVPHTHKEVTSEGLYEQDIWSSQGSAIYMLYCGETPVGFAVVNLASMITGNTQVRDFAEFFIMPSHRRQGCGIWLAHMMFDRYPGKWEIREVPHHDAIRRFWRKAIQAYVGEKFTDTDMDSAEWVGPVQTFNTEDRIGAMVAPLKEDFHRVQ